MFIGSLLLLVSPANEQALVRSLLMKTDTHTIFLGAGNSRALISDQVPFRSQRYHLRAFGLLVVRPPGRGCNLASLSIDPL